MDRMRAGMRRACLLGAELAGSRRPVRWVARSRSWSCGARLPLSPLSLRVLPVNYQQLCSMHNGPHEMVKWGTLAPIDTSLSPRSDAPMPPIALLTALFAIGPAAFQLFLPVLPSLQAHFHISPSRLALTVSLATLSFALTALACGGLADRIGRRPTVLIGMSMLLCGSLVCAGATSIDVLLLGRVLQSAGGAAAMVVTRTVVVDSSSWRP